MKSEPLSASDLQRHITRLEHRVPSTTVRILEESKSPWASFRENPKVLHSEAVLMVEAAFDEGAYVAGGCARWLRRQPAVSAFLRGAYVKAGGDIDLFFRSEEGWKRFVEKAIRATSNEKSRFNVAMSKGNLAANIVMSYGHSYNSAPPIQAICCTVAPPDAMLRGFDFVNAMTAFDRDQSWVAEGWEEHEASKTLAVAWWGSRSVAHRTAKYVQKYAYSTIRDLSNGRMVEQLTAGYDAMDTRRKTVTSSVWRDLMHRDGLRLGMQEKLTILGAATSGLEPKDIFDASKEVGPGSSGTYEYYIADLLKRQEAARLMAREKANDPFYRERDHWKKADDEDEVSPFDVEEYCWAI